MGFCVGCAGEAVTYCAAEYSGAGSTVQWDTRQASGNARVSQGFPPEVFRVHGDEGSSVSVLAVGVC